MKSLILATFKVVIYFALSSHNEFVTLKKMPLFVLWEKKSLAWVNFYFYLSNGVWLPFVDTPIVNHKLYSKSICHHLDDKRCLSKIYCFRFEYFWVYRLDGKYSKFLRSFNTCLI